MGFVTEEKEWDVRSPGSVSLRVAGTQSNVLMELGFYEWRMLLKPAADTTSTRLSTRRTPGKSFRID